jgi:thymidylate synthase (FAD)
MLKAELITHMGDDLLVVNAARVSFDKESEYLEEEADIFRTKRGTFQWDGYGYVDVDEGLVEQILQDRDKKLLNYLAKHNHWTPFSHPQICMRETVPIFVARQRLKHMVGFTYNEVSRRYVDTPPEFYAPDVWRSRPEGSVKQGSGDGEVGYLEDSFGPFDTPSRSYQSLLEMSKGLYEIMLENNIAPEQARMVLPQSMYTSYYVTGSLAAWARAYKQRIDSHAQVEIQDLAKQWDEVIKPLFPESWAVLTEEKV